MPLKVSQSNSSDYFEDDDSLFLEALGNAILPGDVPPPKEDKTLAAQESLLEPPPSTQPSLKRRYEDDAAAADDGIYGAAHFGDFGEYMRRKRAKLQIQNTEMSQESSGKSQIFKGLAVYINGWTKPSVQELRLVTHIITCSLTPAKIREFKNMKVVRPEWLTESIKQEHLLPWKDFIYIHEERGESSQGIRNTQATIDIPGSSNFLKPKRPIAVDPLYCTDPVTKADAARVPGYAADKSNPNAQRVMANPEWRKAHTSVSSDFIEGYYKNSRLHHLSTWKAELKNLVQEAQERAESGKFTGHVGKVDSEGEKIEGAPTGVTMKRAELVMKSPSARWKGKAKAADEQGRVIMHCDFDCFFVSAGLVSRPELKGKPVIVCHSQGAQGGSSSTSEIASSSYEARRFGIKNGMSLQQARQLCPEVITIPYEFERYKEFSLLFYTVLMSHADDLQAVSVDEALIDVTATVNQLRAQSGSQDPAKDYAETIRAQVRKATNCEISVGISHNILLARLATRRAKPGGSYHLLPEDVQEFLSPLTISDLHGFGWSTKQKAQEKLGTVTLAELMKKSKGILIDALGKATGETLYNSLRGIDDKKLESDKPRKSVSCEINYGIRFEDNDQAEEFIYQMATEVKKRLDAIDMVGRSITLKIMKRDPTAPVEPPKFLGHGVCDLFNKQTPLLGSGGKATSDDKVIGSHAWRLLKSFNFDPKELRGIGIQVQKLESASASSTVPLGQRVLPFKPKPPAIGTSKDADALLNLPAAPIQESKKKDEEMLAGDPVKRSTVQYDLPSLSQVDRSVFDALPQGVREELENEYRRRSASPFTSVPPEPQRQGPLGVIRPVKSSIFSSRRSVTPAVFPERPGNANRAFNAKRITQQLGPRGRASISPHKSVLHVWADKLREEERKKKASKGVKITDAALRNLKLDPEVFRALPTKVQREQLIMARIIKEKGTIPEPPAERIILKPNKFELPPGFVVYRAPKPKARYPQPPFLRQRGKDKKEKLYFTETDDIQRILETWVMTYRHWAPKEKDVEFLSKFLEQSVDKERATDVGVERAVAVMKWWLVLLRRLFPSAEFYADDSDDSDSSQRNTVGEAWWMACHGVQEKMNEVTRKRFGGRLSYR